MKKHLISYGDSNYAMQKEFLKETALASGFFDEIKIFSAEDIDPEFGQHIFRFVKGGRGGGYWVWKPYFIKRVIDEIAEGDLLFYVDAGCMINGKAKERFDQYVSMVTAAETGTLDFELPFPEFQYTKQEVFEYFSSPDVIRRSSQLMATIIILRKCKHALMLVNKWYDTLMDDFSLFTDEVILTQNDAFVDHRHDQSIFSIIRKTYGANIIPDETYFLDFLKDGQDSPIWATRLRG
ncbi:MAG: hypothetical protein ABWY16_15580 [Pedobacter sp.]|uniref:hypothetical protein n=1 Tax=Pedobacter sp. TaxID=1411316 RepID=UPI003391153F